jgi:hypothetical protein
MSRSSVKAALTPKQRRRDVVENDEYAGFIRRIVRAYGRRVSNGDIEALREIATRIGVTRQAAQQRWGGDRDA